MRYTSRMMYTVYINNVLHHNVRDDGVEWHNNSGHAHQVATVQQNLHLYSINSLPCTGQSVT